MREIIRHLVRREIKVRYKASVLGFFWSFLRPVFLLLILSVVFSLVLRFEVDYEIPCRFAKGWTGGTYPVFLLVALIPWLFTIGALNDAVGSLVGNAPLIQKVAIRTEVFPLSSVLSNLVNLFFSLLIFLPALFLFFEIPLQRSLLLFPVLILVQFLLTLGLAYVLALGNVFFRDVGILFEFVGMAWFYFTPIFYPFSYVLDHLASETGWVVGLYLINPMTILVYGYRWVFLSGLESKAADLSSSQIGYGILSLALWTLAALFAGVILFNRHRNQIADEL